MPAQGMFGTTTKGKYKIRMRYQLHHLTTSFIVLLILSASIGFTSPLLAQEKLESLTDSELESSLGSLPEAQKPAILAELVWRYRNNQTKQALIYGEQALVLLARYPDPKVETKVLYSIAWAHMRDGDYERAKLRAKLCQDIAKQIDDKASEAFAVNVLGSVEWFKGDFLNALAYFLETLDIRLAIGNKKDIGRSYNNIGSVYQEIGDYEQAIHYHQLSLEIMQEIGYDYGVGSSYFNLGIIYQRLENIAEEEYYLKKALDKFTELNDEAALSEVQINLGLLDIKLEKLDEAMQLFQSSFAISTRLSNQSLLSRSLLGMAEVYYRKANIEQAKSYVEQSLAISSELKEKTQLRDIYELQSKIYRRMGEFKKALISFEKFHEMKGSILENVYEGNLSLLQQQFDSEKQKAKIALLEKEKSLSQLKAQQALTESNYLTYGLLLAAILITIIVIQYFKLHRKNQQTYRNSITDNLCGCYNRHYLFSVLIPRMVNQKNRVFAMLIDLDNFKKVNDEYGHDIGDKLLATFSQRVLKSLTSDNCLIRLGGEEFVVFGTSNTEAKVHELAETIRTSISGNLFSLNDDIKLEVTCSIGLALDHITGENDVVKLIKKADLAMYQAKREGRNRVIGSGLRT